MVANHQGGKYQSGMRPSKPDFRNWHFPDIADLADDVCFVGAKRTSQPRRHHPTPACSAMSMLDPAVTTGSTIPPAA
jgi:hypothetical protein